MTMSAIGFEAMARPVVYLGHGASGDAKSMAPFVDGLAKRGYEAHALTLPVRRAEDALAAFDDQVPDGPDVVIGGQSYGGRVASLAVAEGDRRFAGLVCFCYPLHRPGSPDMEDRTAHWARIQCPALLLSGEADPFARIDLLRAAMPRLPKGELVTFPRVGHSMKPVLDDALDRVAAFLEVLAKRPTT
jgi:predicted alpha/beta-hydrolase family hydrolase